MGDQRTALRQEVVKSGIRWTSNILVELLGNHGEHVPLKVRDALRSAVVNLSDAQSPQAWSEKDDTE